MTRILAFATLLVAAAGGWFWWSAQPVVPGVTPFTLGAQEAAEADTSMVKDMVLGQEDAPVTVIEYASFTCPHCRDFHDNVFPELKSEYIDTGKVKFILREVYFDRFGLWAGMLARCGDDARYYGFVDLIFDNQSEWLAGGDEAAIAENLRKLGRTAGLSDEEVNACMQDEAMARALVAAYQENATADGIEATPSFIIDGTKYSNMPWDDFKAILDQELAE